MKRRLRLKYARKLAESLRRESGYVQFRERINAVTPADHGLWITLGTRKPTFFPVAYYEEASA